MGSQEGEELFQGLNNDLLMTAWIWWQTESSGILNPMETIELQELYNNDPRND